MRRRIIGGIILVFITGLGIALLKQPQPTPPVTAIVVQQPKPLQYYGKSPIIFTEIAPPALLANPDIAALFAVTPKPVILPPKKIAPTLPPVAVPPVLKTDDRVVAATGKVAIVIDDMGLNQYLTHQAMLLPIPMTTAFIPYGDNLSKQTAMAKSMGHEVMVHIPMEPMSTSENPGKNALLTSLNAAELQRRIDWNLSQFTGYTAVNNHMGSKFTQHADGLKLVMAALKKRGVYFLDSKTIASSVAGSMAHNAGVPTLSRNIFLDDIDSIPNVLQQLQACARLAKTNGSCIAIGHPRRNTIAALQQWIPKAKAQGIIFVHTQDLLKKSLNKTAISH